MALVAARARAVDRERQHLAAERGCAAEDVGETEAARATEGRFVVYTSDQAHSSVMKAAMIAGTGSGPENFRALPTSAPDWGLRGDALRRAVEEDRAGGRIPLMVVATLGTTGVGACDSLRELGPVAREAGVWVHVVRGARRGVCACCGGSRRAW